MSTTIPQSPRATVVPLNSLGWLSLGVILAAHLPLLVRHGQQIWLRPHYQFFPFALAGAAVLAWRRLRGLEAVSPGKAYLAVPALATSWLLLAAAEVLSSSWLGWVSALAVLASLTFAVGGWALCRRLWPAWAMLWLVLPPPLELDRDLILWLQGWTTRWSSAILDVLGVFHVMAGNVVEIDGRRLLVADACSGVNSLFSVLACTLFLVLLLRRPVARAVLLLASAVFWVLAANVARVVLIGLLLARHSIDLSEGWRHEALGFGLFAVAVGLIASTDQLLAFLLSPADAALAPTPTNPIAAGERMTWLAVLAAPAYLLLLGGHVAAHGWSAAPATEVATQQRPEALDEDTLPKKFGAWQRQSFRGESRPVGNYFGENSHTWVYRNGQRTAIFSLDHPFPGWHDLTRCYTGQGWQIDEQVVRDPEGLPGGLVRVRLDKPGYRTGHLLFCQFNGQGEPLRARRGAAHLSVFRHGRTFQSLWSAEKDPPHPVYQWQVMVEGHSRLTTEEEEALEGWFVQAYGLVRKP